MQWYLLIFMNIRKGITGKEHTCSLEENKYENTWGQSITEQLQCVNMIKNK
jgi:hypothetical protein